MLRTWDLKGTIAFYTDTLGFACERGSDEFGWASLRRDNVNIMVTGPNEHEDAGRTSPAFTGSLYIETDRVDDLWRGLKDKARLCYPIEDFEYGMREFAIYDNNGYILQFGQPVVERRG